MPGGTRAESLYLELSADSHRPPALPEAMPTSASIRKGTTATATYLNQKLKKKHCLEQQKRREESFERTHKQNEIGNTYPDHRPVIINNR